jgi:hypothetical protein
VLSTVSETRLARLTDLSALLPNSCFRADFALLRLEACVYFGIFGNHGNFGNSWSHLCLAALK